MSEMQLGTPPVEPPVTETPPATPTETTEPPKTEEKPKEPAKPSLLTEADKTGAPERYEDFTVPEGFELDETVAKEAGDLFKTLNLNQSQAQQLVNFYVAKTEAAAQAPYKLWHDTQETWRNEIKADPEIGGKLDQVKSTIAKAIDGLGDAKLATGFREAMDYTGAGNNPAFIRAFYRLAQKVTEGTHVAPGGPTQVNPPGSRPSAARALYPDLPG